jgi:hypothetical protein
LAEIVAPFPASPSYALMAVSRSVPLYTRAEALPWFE